jgi:hypothetical protein
MLRVAARWLLPVVCFTLLSACEDQPTQPGYSDSPGFNVQAAEFEFTPLAAQAACRTPTTAAGYRPLDLPAGFQQTIIATEIDDFIPVAGTGANLPDMVTLNETGPHAGRYLYRTHEVGSNGAVTVTDLLTGVTSLVDQQSHYEALDGIAWTPWHTLLFAEERIVATFDDPRVPNAVGGLVYEWDPATGISVPRPAVGARSHEGLRFDPQGNLYGISETTGGVNGSGGIYKFVPDRRGDLSSGQLYALKVLNPTTRTGPAVWVPLDRAASEINSDASAIAMGATGWGRPEDIEIGTSTGNGGGAQHVLYVAVTSEDLILRIELNGDEAYVSNFLQDGVNATGMTDPDNLALDKWGNLYIAEDRSAGDIFKVVAGPRDRVATSALRFASLSDCSAEPTGIYFDTNGKKLFVNVQHAGGTAQNDLTVVIERAR